jgi:protein-S-isoprenylcysteine O-methyltransferase Ste14
MNKYKKIFGVGPLGAALSLVLLYIFWEIDHYFEHPALTTNLILIQIIGILSILIGLGIHFWTIWILRTWWVDNQICKSGPFKYIRHPMYAAWIIFVVSGVSLYLNSWVFLLWPLSIQPFWHIIVGREEKLLDEVFGDEYRLYLKSTGRFFPRIFSLSFRAEDS